MDLICLIKNFRYFNLYFSTVIYRKLAQTCKFLHEYCSKNLQDWKKTCNMIYEILYSDIVPYNTYLLARISRIFCKLDKAFILEPISIPKHYENLYIKFRNNFNLPCELKTTNSPGGYVYCYKIIIYTNPIKIEDFILFRSILGNDKSIGIFYDCVFHRIFTSIDDAKLYQDFVANNLFEIVVKIKNKINSKINYKK